MHITVIGAGYVGIPTAAVFAKLGHTVCLLDVDEKKIGALRQGKLPFFEPGLAEAVGEQLSSGALSVTTEYNAAIAHAEVVFICVGTPPLPTGEADLSYVFSAARSIAENFGPHRTLIVTKSTVPVGTAEKVRKIISDVTLSSKGGSASGGSLSRDLAQFDLASCPEFLPEGSALADALNPDRIVIGADTDRAREILLKLHEGLPGARVVTDVRTAELIKYACNAFLATKIFFINEIASLCEQTGANVADVATAMGMDKRIGPAFLRAGIGYGGSCFPKDTRALASIASGHNHDFQLLKAVIEVNQQQRARFLEKVKLILGGVSGKRIGVLGLAFKNNTDDVRESAALEIVAYLMKDGASVVAYDPKAEANAKIALPALVTCSTAAEALQHADAALILTEWTEFRDLPWQQLKSLMRQPIIPDGKNLLDPSQMRASGFTYVSVGRP